MPRRTRQGVYVRLICELGADFNEMYLEWLKRARGEVASGTESKDRLGVGGT